MAVAPARLQVPGGAVEYRWWPGSGRVGPPLVLLHEGLGSVGLWRDFPGRMAAAAGMPVLAYSRHGYGGSDPAAQPRRPGFMHDEALTVLPAVLDALQVHQPVLLGHSDGGSIALIHAACAGRAVAGLIVVAPHVCVEEITLEGIRRAREAYAAGALRERLARHHRDVDATFRGWNDIWLHEDFRTWNIEALLARITVPVLAVQGDADEYGSLDQIARIGRQVPGAQLLEIPGCGHWPHRDAADTLLAAACAFLARLPVAGAWG